MPTFEPGPLLRLDVDAVLQGDLVYDFEQTATEGLSGVDDADARIGDAADRMRGDLAANDPASLDAAIGAADTAHQAQQAATYAPSVDEVAAAEAERVRLGGLQAVLPHDGVSVAPPEAELGESRLEGVDVDYDALADLPGYLDRQLADFRDRLEQLGKVPPRQDPRPSPAPQPEPTPTEKPPSGNPPPPIVIPPPIDDNPDDHGGITPPPPDDGNGDTGDGSTFEPGPPIKFQGEN